MATFAKPENALKRAEGGEVTKEPVLELVLRGQLKERREAEKKLQKLAETMVYMERAKREEEASLIEQAFQQRSIEEKKSL